MRSKSLRNIEGVEEDGLPISSLVVFFFLITTALFSVDVKCFLCFIFARVLNVSTLSQITRRRQKNFSGFC